ncbi:hypothetical protein niasHS_001117 [Heterodera schachtii]|uniref:polynucleotide adenylyltransferase n=1 Tax=Heterodera schachtii TaxID=97005 RepID=A0ABD2KCE6_HETSC
MASIKKQILDMRIYLGRIWHILGAFYRHKKAGGNISEKDNEFLNERSQKFFSLNEIDNRFPLAYCHDTWYRMAKLYNEIIAIGGTEENGEKKAIEIKNGDAQTIEAMRNEIIEDHVINVLQLMRSSNAFSDHFRNANKESKRQLRMFLAQTMFSKDNARSDQEIIMEYEQLMDKFPSLRELLRNELTAKQIEEKQLKYYIDFLDSKNEKKVWKLAQFLLDILAYCQWFHFFDDHILNEQLKNSIEAPINYPSQAKSYMFSLIFTAQKEVALFMAQNENGGEKMPTDKQIDDGTALKAMHEQIVGKLLNSKAFRDKLKKIEINKKRMSDLIGDGTEIGNNLLSESHKRKFEPKGKEIIKTGKQKQTQKAAKGKGQQQNEAPKSDEQIFVPLFTDTDLYAFAYIYKQVLINHINDSAIKEFNVHVTHFRYKDTINALIWKIFTMETAQNEKLERIRTLILDIAQIENFGEKLANTLEEKKKICSMESFFNWITQNDTLYSESAEWRSFLATISPKTEAMAENVQPTEEKKVASFYENIFDAQNTEAARAKEMELALIRAVQHILLNDRREKTAVQSQRQKDEPHTLYLFMVLSVLDLFDDEVPARRTARMLCMALPSAKETTPKGKRQRNAKRGTTIGQLVEKCLDNDIQNIERKTFADQREMAAAQWHSKFFAHYLPNFPANDPLLKRIRQTVGALHTLNLLMGGDELDNLLANNEFVPAKLGVDRLSARLMADLLVLMDNTDQISAQIGSKHLTNLWWLNFRLLYETVAAEAENAPKCALSLKNLLEEMDIFLDSNKKLEIGTSNSKANIGIVWFIKWKEANGKTEIQWHGQKHEQMVANNEKVQKMHMDKLGKQLASEKGGENDEFEQILHEYDTQSEEIDEKWNKIEKKRTESQRKRQSQKQRQLISAKVINATLLDLCDNEPLVQKYKNEILQNVQPYAMNILNLCAFKNEIETRIRMLNESSKIIGNEAKIEQNLMANWEESSKIKMERQNDVIIWEEKLSEILHEILMHQNGQWQNLINAEFNEFKTENYEQKRMIWQNLRSQIHLNNILMAFEEENELAKSWEKFGTETKWKKLKNLTNRQMPILQFNALVENYRKMGKQIEIDQKLFASAVLTNNHFEEGRYYLPPNYAKLSQQITILNPMLVANEAAKEFENYLTSNVYKNIYVQQNFYRIKMEGALQQIVTLVEKWSNGLAQLLISGSLLLHSHTIGSDVNLVCLTPGEKLKVSDFMGNDRNSKCEENKCTDEENSSLFCQICEHKSTTNLIKIESDSLLIVRFQFDGIEFDISLVAIPKIEQLEKINAEMLEKLAEKFNDSIFEQKNMGRTLASYRSTLFVANLFYHPIKISDCLDSFRDILARQQTMSENGRNFRHLLITTKFWAKNNYIYSNKMGFLNGMSLAIIVAKIVLLFPNSSLQFLLESFFLIYSTRRQQIPIQLTKIDAHNFNLFVAMNKKELEMPVLTPELQFHPLQNATRFVTHSNAKVIRHEMAQALQKINSLKNDKFNLGAFLSEPIPFTEKFQNFLVIHCISEQKELADSFCDFVEWRMRLQIIFSIDKKGGGQSVATHLKPNIHREKCNLATAKLLGISFRSNFCKVWLLGIISHPIKNRDEIISMANHFDLTIKSHFHQRRNRENSAIYWLEVAAKLELKTMLMSRDELVKLEKDEEEEK